MSEAEVMAIMKAHRLHRADKQRLDGGGCIETVRGPERAYGDKPCLVWVLADAVLDAWAVQTSR